MSSRRAGDWSPADPSSWPWTLEAEDVARILRRSPQTIWRWWRERNLPRRATRRGQRTHMTRAQLLRWLDEHPEHSRSPGLTSERGGSDSG